MGSVALVHEACPLCGQKCNQQILLHKRLKDVSEFHNKCIAVSQSPCEECKEHMNAGFLVIEVEDETTTDEKDPYRTGHLFVIKLDAAERIFGPQKIRAAFVTVKTTRKLGFYDAKEENDR